MSSTRVRVRRADAAPGDEDVEVGLTPAPGGWSPQLTAAVADAVGVNVQNAFVSVRFADGTSEELPAGRAGWLTIKGMENGDVLVVHSGAAAAAAAAAPALSPATPQLSSTKTPTHSGQG
jgi:hypothetical protein